MTKDEIIEKLELMRDLADTSDIKEALQAALGAIEAVDKITNIACNASLSDKEIGAIIRSSVAMAIRFMELEDPN